MTNALFCFTLAVTLLLNRILLSNGEIKAAISEILDLAADGKLERVATVLSENADAVNYRNHLGFTPLIMATSNGHLELVKYLLGQRADPNTVENDLWSPLMFAAYKGYTEIAFELFTAGANPLLRNKNGVTAHEIARNRENLETSRVIGEESVLYAIAFGSLDDVMLHIRLGVNPNLQNSVGWTPLMVASSSQSYDATLELINLGANVNMQERDGWTALLFAAHNGNRDIAELLVKSGADVSHKTKDQRTALQQATTQQHREVVHFLQNYGKEEFAVDAAVSTNDKGGTGNDVDQVEPTIQPVVTVSTPPEKPQKKKKRFLGIF